MRERYVTVVLPAVNMGDSVRALRTEVTADGSSSVVNEAPQKSASSIAGKSYSLMESRQCRKAGSGRNTKYWWRRGVAVMQIQVDVDDGRPRVLIAQFPLTCLQSAAARDCLRNAIIACTISASMPLEQSVLKAAIDDFQRHMVSDSTPEDANE